MIWISASFHAVTPFFQNLLKWFDKIFVDVTVDSTFVEYQNILAAIIAIQDSFLEQGVSITQSNLKQGGSGCTLMVHFLFWPSSKPATRLLGRPCWLHLKYFFP
jgi:hypothetical protein